MIQVVSEGPPAGPPWCLETSVSRTVVRLIVEVFPWSFWTQGTEGYLKNIFSSPKTLTTRASKELNRNNLFHNRVKTTDRVKIVFSCFLFVFLFVFLLVVFCLKYELSSEKFFVWSFTAFYTASIVYSLKFSSVNNLCIKFKVYFSHEVLIHHIYDSTYIQHEFQKCSEIWL